jgi:hypothetical protein
MGARNGACKMIIVRYLLKSIGSARTVGSVNWLGLDFYSGFVKRISIT